MLNLIEVYEQYIRHRLRWLALLSDLLKKEVIA
jgi:hypothetical protein